APQGAGGVIATYPYRFAPPVNTGLMPDPPQDFDDDGQVGEQGDDSYGFGAYPGQYGFLILSKYPILVDEVRCFQTFLWRDMPDALLPMHEDLTPFFSDDELAVFRLSSKNHCDVPVDVEGEVLHVLASHPTPPAFDGPEDRNGRRNHDEIRFWRDYVAEDPAESDYIVDDDGEFGGLGSDAPYVVVGDLNADPNDGESVDAAALSVLSGHRVNHTILPLSLGAVEASILQGGVNDAHIGSPGLDTADFGEPPGNLRVDYVLPSTAVERAGVFWPQELDAQASLLDVSDHRLVWADLLVSVPAPIPPRYTATPLDGRPETIRSQETNLGDLVVDAVLWEGKRSHMAAGAPEPVLALHNGGNIRNGTVIPVGEVSDGLIEQILKFDNHVVIVEDVTAATLRDLLEVAVADLPSDFNGAFAHVAGLRFTWDPLALPGARITQVTVLADPEVEVVIDGVLQPDAGPFDVATNDYEAMEGNADGWPLGAFSNIEVAPSIRQSLIDYIEHFPAKTVPKAQYPEGVHERIFEASP
ncbi:MAG: 5'-nucleotidase C-terminal domain-containing protein, partial [Myxococcales bacterium]|nr:5'-nucleotidase C-terminal domain-containing protein [Myxococcales bacterium]